jgi:7-cyano-7-deazaguanine reductase
VPDKLCVELRGLKLYVWSFRDRGAFHEAVTNEILNRLADAISPRFMRLTASFNVRGGIYTSVIAERRATHWHPPEPVKLP